VMYLLSAVVSWSRTTLISHLILKTRVSEFRSE
jgi:hypothetical protein